MRKSVNLWWLWAGLAFCILGSAVSLMARQRVESRNKATMIAFEYDTLQRAAQSQDKPLALVEYALKNPGGLGVVLSEQTVKDFVDDQRLKIEVGETVQLSGEIRLLQAAKLEAQARNIDCDLVSARVKDSRLSQTVLEFLVPISPTTLLQFPLGADPLQIDELRSSKIPIIVRFANRPGMQESYLVSIIAKAKLDGVWGYLPVGDQVLGFRYSHKVVADALKDNEIYYLSPEFAKIAGEATMLAAHPDNDIRLHSIQAQEIDKMTPGGVAERFAKAFSERNMRVLLLRPVDVKGGTSGQQLDATFDLIRKAVEKEHGKITLPKPFEEPGVSRVLFAIIGLGVGMATTGICLELVRKQSLLWAIIGGILLALGAYTETGRGYVGIIAGVVWPCIAVWFWSQNRSWNHIKSMAVMSGITMVGGLCIAGLLNGLPYLVKADAFSGVKIVLFVPIIMLTIWLADKEYGWKKLMANPLTAGSLITGLSCLTLVAFMLSRTGNDSPAGVSGFELQLRSLLENFLVVRPRTKEFLIGHPAMLVGIYLAAREAKKKISLSPLTITLLGVGLIGQTSMVNTMCHLHTPLSISLTRILIGWIIGIVLGIIFIAFIGSSTRSPKITT